MMTQKTSYGNQIHHLIHKNMSLVVSAPGTREKMVMTL